MSPRWRRRLMPLISILAVLSVLSLALLSPSLSSLRPLDLSLYDENNFGPNDGLLVLKQRQKEARSEEMKHILMWNDAYGIRKYDIGHGREPFYKYLCPETRCIATANRSYLANVKDFDALLIHQRGIDWNDMPKERTSEQRYVMWVAESAQYLFMDIHKLNNYFNWTMTYKENSDFPRPYGRIHQIKSHPSGSALQTYIEHFGERNRFLASSEPKQNRSGSRVRVAWFNSHCATVARRERYVSVLRQLVDVDVFGKCGSLKCDRKNETHCYDMLERNYRFYLSFENSLCDDYVTEKFFNIMHRDVIPVVFNGANMSRIAPPHSNINVFDFATPQQLAAHLQLLQQDDAKFAEYFWWRDFYQVRNRKADVAQSYCELCRRLHDPSEPRKVYEDMHKWWVTDSNCKQLKPRFTRP